MLRLFAALPVSTDQKRELTSLQKGLIGASWRPIENFHVTLRFFGDVDRRAAEALDDEIAGIEARQFPLGLSGAGWFGRREPYSVWAGVRADDALTGLADACERAARRVGLPAEKRPYRPHVTLAYCHGTPLEDARVWTERHQDFSSGPDWADRFHLYSSHTGRGPSRYVPEADYVLG